jgi:hypothetical protein
MILKWEKRKYITCFFFRARMELDVEKNTIYAMRQPLLGCVYAEIMAYVPMVHF